MLLISPPERSIHEYYMRMALSLARRGAGHVSPNPQVGCVLVDYGTPEGRVASLGYHRRYGAPHAEADALANARLDASGCTAYVNLEPCCHTGHTPPCCDALIRAGISRVVVGMADPDPRVSGGGVSALEKAGVEVIPGVLEDECRWLNRGFVKRVTSGRPWVTVKAAISIDGNMAMADGQSKWITCAESRRRAHIARAENDAVMVGIGTILNDDPQLDVRDSDGHSPMKAVVDRDLRIPPRALALKGGNCAVFTGRPADGAKASELRSSGAKIIEMDTDGGGHIPPGLMLRELAAMGVNRLMVEGGAGIAGSFIKSGLVDEYSVFIAPKLMGSGIKMSERLSFSLMEDAIPLKKFSARDVGGDIWFRGAPSCSRG